MCNRLIEEDLPEKVTFPQIPEGHEGGSFVDVWGKSLLGRGISQCKGPGVGTSLVWGTVGRPGNWIGAGKGERVLGESGRPRDCQLW